MSLIFMSQDKKFFKCLRSRQGKGLKILTPKQILKRLPIALAQINARNNSEILLNEIGQIIYSLYITT